MLKIRQSWDCLIFNMGIPILVRHYIYIEMAPWFNIKTTSYQYRKSHCGDKTDVRSSDLHNGISYTGKMSSLYGISPPGCFWSLWCWGQNMFQISWSMPWLFMPWLHGCWCPGSMCWQISSSHDIFCRIAVILSSWRKGFSNACHLSVEKWKKKCKHDFSFKLVTNISTILLPSDIIWRQRPGSILAQVMACSLTAHYLKQYWLSINRVLWHSVVISLEFLKITY